MLVAARNAGPALARPMSALSMARGQRSQPWIGGDRSTRAVRGNRRSASRRPQGRRSLSLDEGLDFIRAPFAPTAGGPAATRPFPSRAADMYRRGSKPSSAWLRPAAEVAKCCHVAGDRHEPAALACCPSAAPIRAIMVMARYTPARWSSGRSRGLAAAHYIQLRLVRRRTRGPLGSDREGQG